ncbi:MAG: DUF6427 family protein [Ferruginibacter sp.]
MTGIFKSNNPYNNFLLLIYGLLLKLYIFIEPTTPVAQQTDGFLFRALLVQLKPLGKNLPIIYPIIAFLLIFTQAVTLNKLVNDQRLMQKPNYLTGMAYLLISSIFTEWNILSAPLIINTFLLWVWAKMSAIYTLTNPKATLFNIGLVIGICTFFYFPSIAFAILVVAGLVITRPFKLAEWLVALLGIITPYYFLLSYVFLTDKWKGYKFPGFSVGLPRFFETSWALVAIVLVLLATIIGIYFIRSNFRRQLVQIRKSWSLVFLYALVAAFVPCINATRTFEYWILCAVPLALFTGCAFLYPNKRWMPAIIHWCMVAMVILFGYVLR